MSKKYDRSVVISKLLTKGLIPKPNRNKIEYFVVPNRVHIGLKILGMLDFFKIKIERPKQKKRKLGEEYKEKPRRSKIKMIGTCVVCHKEASNIDGFFRLTYRNAIIKIHNKCKNKADFLIEGGLTVEELERMK